MKATIWRNMKIIIYLGGDPEKNKAPEITLELDKPQIQMDFDKNTITISETK